MGEDFVCTSTSIEAIECEELDTKIRMDVIGGGDSQVIQACPTPEIKTSKKGTPS